MDVNLLRFARVLTFGIAAGATASSPFNLGAFAGARVAFPPNYVGGTASFKASTATDMGSAPAVSTSGWRTVYDNLGAAVALPAASKRSIVLPDAVMIGAWTRIVSATKQTTTAGAATFSVVVKG